MNQSNFAPRAQMPEEKFQDSSSNHALAHRLQPRRIRRHLDQPPSLLRVLVVAELHSRPHLARRVTKLHMASNLPSNIISKPIWTQTSARRIGKRGSWRRVSIRSRRKRCGGNQRSTEEMNNFQDSVILRWERESIGGCRFSLRSELGEVTSKVKCYGPETDLVTSKYETNIKSPYQGCRPVERMDLIGGSTSTGCFASPSSSSYPANPNNIDTNSLIPWLKNLSSGSSSSSSSMPPHPFIHNGSISAPVTPPLSSPTCRTPRLNPERDALNWVGQCPFLPLSTPQSPGHQSVPVSEWFAGIRIRNGPSQPTSPTFSLVSPSPFGGGSLMATPGQSGTCSPAIPDVIMTQAIPDEFAFGSNPKGMVKAWEGEIIHEEDTGSDDLELTLGGGSRPR